MSQTNTPDRTDPDHNWTGNGQVASNTDVADAVAHVKAWFKRELASLETSAGPTVTALESRVAELEAKLKAAVTPAPAPMQQTPIANPTGGGSGA